MDQNNPNDNSGFGSGTTGSTTGTGSTGTGSSFNTGGTGSGMTGGGGMSTTGSGGTGGFGVTSGSDFGSGGTGSGGGLGSSGGGATGSGGGATGGDSGVCAHCGQSMSGAGLNQFLSRLGITEDMMNNLKGQFQNVDIDEYLNTARDYLKDSGGKAQTFAKENPGKVAAGVAALALGAGLIYAAVNRDKA